MHCRSRRVAVHFFVTYICLFKNFVVTLQKFWYAHQNKKTTQHYNQTIWATTTKPQ